MSLPRQQYKSNVKLKQFVKEQSVIPDSIKNIHSNEFMKKEGLTGAKARLFYENILSSPSQCEIKEFSMKKKSGCYKKTMTNLKTKDILAFAQNNDVKKLKLYLNEIKDCDLNIVDDFGWTPLMCAACSGAADAVKILLENKADPLIKDKLGNTALKLAEQKNHGDVVALLKKHNNQKLALSNKKINEVTDIFYCEICKNEFASGKNHESSTLHLFNSNLKSLTYYGIPESNKGFQLLLKEGWKKDSGLGPDGNGRKFPVKATLKRDRAGIGAFEEGNKEKERVCPDKKYKKKFQGCSKLKEKNFEKYFRLEFSGS